MVASMDTAVLVTTDNNNSARHNGTEPLRSYSQWRVFRHITDFPVCSRFKSGPDYSLIYYILPKISPNGHYLWSIHARRGAKRKLIKRNFAHDTSSEIIFEMIQIIRIHSFRLKMLTHDYK